MIVVSDTSPLTALLTVGAESLLPNLFGEVVIPRAVLAELQRSHAIIPSWIKVEDIQDSSQIDRFTKMVDIGEAEALELAKELHADRLLMDDRKGRQLAARENIPVIGLLGIVLLAKGRQPKFRNMIEPLSWEWVGTRMVICANPCIRTPRASGIPVNNIVFEFIWPGKLLSNSSAVGYCLIAYDCTVNSAARRSY